MAYVPIRHSTLKLHRGGLPSLVRSCISCIVARASVCNPENNGLIWIFADLSPVVRLSVAIFQLHRIAFYFKA